MFNTIMHIIKVVVSESKFQNKDKIYFSFPGRSKRTPRRKEIERKQSMDIERWLKNKFREGFANMREAFEFKDTKNTGTVCMVAFLFNDFQGYNKRCC